MTGTCTYTTELRTECVHLHSGTMIYTDAPLDNHGKAQAFSPTDLVATALASCLLTTIALSGRTHNFNIDGAKAGFTKHMVNDPRRIARIDVDVTMPQRAYTDKEKTMIEHIGNNCPVTKSLHSDIEVNIVYKW